MIAVTDIIGFSFFIIFTITEISPRRRRHSNSHLTQRPPSILQSRRNTQKHYEQSPITVTTVKSHEDNRESTTTVKSHENNRESRARVLVPSPGARVALSVSGSRVVWLWRRRRRSRTRSLIVHLFSSSSAVGEAKTAAQFQRRTAEIREPCVTVRRRDDVSSGFHVRKFGLEGGEGVMGGECWWWLIAAVAWIPNHGTVSLMLEKGSLL